MGTYRVFAYNPQQDNIEGTDRTGLISAGFKGTTVDTNYEWWNGPDEDTGYVIAYVDSNGNRSNGPETKLQTNFPCHIGFFKSRQKTEQSFIELAQSISGQSFTSGYLAKDWLSSNNYWSSFPYRFTTTWDTRQGDGSNTIILPLVNGGTYSFVVDWGDGSTSSVTSFYDSNKTHTYLNSTIYDVSISGTIEGWSFAKAARDLDYDGISSYDSRLKIVDVKSWGNLKLGNFGGHFYNCENLNISARDVLNLDGVTSLESSFRACNSLVSIKNINYWDVSGVTIMDYLFSDSRPFYAENYSSSLSLWDVSNVTSMLAMFASTNYNDDINRWNVAKVTDMTYMFSSTLFDSNIGSWNVGEVRSTEGMFYKCPFNQPINNWKFKFVGNMKDMFNSSPFDQPIYRWDVSTVTNMSGMFNGSSFNQQVDNWDVSNVTNFNNMFANTSKFNQSLNSWNLGSATDISYMFYNAQEFNQPINNWNVQGVNNMEGIFAGTGNFNQPINDWQVYNVTNMSYMFSNTRFFNQPLDSWNVSSVTNMSYMFESSNFNQPISNWSVSSVTSMEAMFISSQFNQPLNSWDTGSVTNMSNMFANSQFNQPIGKWSVSNVTTMNSMFSGNTSFNQSISEWNVSIVTDMRYMFYFSSGFNQNISSWNVSNVGLFNGFMSGKTTGDYSYYNDLLISWSSLNLAGGVTLDMGSIQYTSEANTAKTNIVNNYGWNINDGGLEIPSEV